MPVSTIDFLKQAHRDGCMCIICNQARRVGRLWRTMSGMVGVPKWQAPMLTGRRSQSMPHLARGLFWMSCPPCLWAQGRPLMLLLGVAVLHTDGRPPPPSIISWSVCTTKKVVCRHESVNPLCSTKHVSFHLGNGLPSQQVPQRAVHVSEKP